MHCLVVCERPVCVAGGAVPAFTPEPRGALAPPPISRSFHLPFLVSLLYSRSWPTPFPVSSAPARPPPTAGLEGPCLTSSPPSPLSLLLSLLSRQLPADRVRQVHPVLRAPGPPSTSSQIPPSPRRPPFPSLPGRLFCDLTVATQPQSHPFICDLVCCSGELTHPGAMLVKLVPLCGVAPAPFYKYL